MNFRRITSLTLLLSFIFCILTSVVLFIMPHGRVAFWSNWRLWGLEKNEWSALHINLGILFLLAGGLHLYYNWKPIVAYLKDHSRKLRIFTLNFNLALLLVLVVGLGTLWHLPPMSTVVGFEEAVKDRAGMRLGEPPYGHAELSSLKMFCRKIDLDPVKAMELLRQAGISFSNEQQTLQEIAAQNRITPKRLYEIIKPAAKAAEPGAALRFPDMPLPGFGQLRLSEICVEHCLKTPAVIRALADRGVKARPDQTFKEIARENRMQPMRLFELLREAAGTAGSRPPLTLGCSLLIRVFRVFS